MRSSIIQLVFVTTILLGALPALAEDARRIKKDYGACIPDLPFERIKAAVQLPPVPRVLSSGEILPETRVEKQWQDAGKLQIAGVEMPYDHLARLHLRFRPKGVATNEQEKILDYVTMCLQYTARDGSYQE